MIEIPLADQYIMLRESATYCVAYVCCRTENFAYKIKDNTLEVSISSTCTLSDNMLEGVKYEEDGLISRILTGVGTSRTLKDTTSNATLSECVANQRDLNNVLIDTNNTKDIHRTMRLFEKIINNFAAKLSQLSQTSLGREILKACIRKIELVREKLFLRELLHSKLNITSIDIPRDTSTIGELLSTRIEAKVEVRAIFSIDPRTINIELVRELLTSAISGYVTELAELAYKQVIIS